MDTVDLAIESFISYCDDMMIAEEGIKDLGNRIWVSIKALVNKIINWIKNVMLNINYFKNAELNPQMNKDMITVLKLSQAHTESNFKILTSVYKILLTLHMNENHKIKGEEFGVAPDNIFQRFSSTDLKTEMMKCSIDLDESIKQAKESDEYKRLIEDKYNEEQVEMIPLTHIVNELKRSNTEITNMQNNINKIEATTYTIKTDNGRIFSNAVIKFINDIISYYSFRISILGKYLEKAKASLSAFTSNIKDIFNRDNKVTSNYRFGMSKQVTRLKTKEQVQKIKELYENALSAKTYDEYKPYYNELIKLLKIPDGSIIQSLECDPDKFIVQFMFNKGNSDEVPISKSQNLYHGSYIPDLKYLEPSWIGGGQVLFPTPRIYVHANVPLNRTSNLVSGFGYAYKLKVNPSSAYVDKELGITAMWIPANKPIPVERIDPKKIYNSKLNDLNLNF